MIRSSSLRGLPHSDSHGSTLARNSPWLFAARCVLLRRLMPRHSPYALPTLTYLIQLRTSMHSPYFFSSPALSKINIRYQIPAVRYCRFLCSAFGGGERDRTDDPLLAKQVLSQLSYTPDGGPNWNRTNHLTLIRGAL